MNKLRGHLCDPDHNQRRHSRFVLLPPVELILAPCRQGRQEVFKADIANLSENGLACCLSSEEAEAFPPGQSVRIRFQLGFDATSSRVLAQVVHRTRTAEADRELIGLVWHEDEAGQTASLSIRTFLNETAEPTTEVA